MKRIREPEVMEDEQQARAYAQGDFSVPNQLFVDQLLTDFAPVLQHVIDLGCGPADVLVRLAHAQPGIHITGVDGSTPKIHLAQAAIAEVEEQLRIAGLRL